MDKNANYSRLKKFSREQGAALFGVADIRDSKNDFLLSQETLAPFTCAVCLGVRLFGGTLGEIKEAPTRLYFHHYKTANMFLDQLAFKVGSYLQAQGFEAIALPASQIIDWQNQKAHLSHKKMALLAGLGWIGRNNLLVSEEFGAQLRLVTLLTDMPLKADKARQKDCGSCRLCISACPANAIKERPEAFDHLRCFEKLKEFQKKRLVDQYICGVCVNACKGKGKNERGLFDQKRLRKVSERARAS